MSVKPLGLIALLLAGLHCLAPASAREVGTFVSAPDEPLDDFVVRLSVPALNYTYLNGVEVCGFFERASDGRYSIALQTSDHPRLCDIKFPRTDRSASTGVIFHTHAPGGIATFSGEDFTLPGYLAVSGAIYFQSGKLTTRRLMKGRYKPRLNLASMTMPEEIPIFRR